MNSPALRATSTWTGSPALFSFRTHRSASTGLSSSSRIRIGAGEADTVTLSVLSRTAVVEEIPVSTFQSPSVLSAQINHNRLFSAKKSSYFLFFSEPPRLRAEAFALPAAHIAISPFLSSARAHAAFFAGATVKKNLVADLGSDSAHIRPPRFRTIL